MDSPLSSWFGSMTIPVSGSTPPKKLIASLDTISSPSAFPLEIFLHSIIKSHVK